MQRGGRGEGGLCQTTAQTKCGGTKCTSERYRVEYLICILMQIRYSIFGAHLMQPAELHKVEPSILLRIVRATKRFS